MTKCKKLVDRIRVIPSEADFDDVRRVLEMYGWTMRSPQGGSSHFTFTKEGEREIITVVKHHDRVWRVYLDKICDQLGLD